MKIAIFTETYPPEINGVATSARNLYRTLKAHGHQVVVVTTNPFDHELSYQDDIIRIPGIVLKHLYGYVFANPFNKECAKIIEDFKPDVIHVQTEAFVGQMGFILAKKLDIPTVYTFHTMIEDYTYYATKGYFDRASKSIVRNYVRHIINEADEFITPSIKIREYMRSIHVDAYISVIPTGIDFSIFNRKSIDKDVVRSLKNKYGISDNDKIILSLGRVAKEKSIDVCIRGFSLYTKKHPEDQNTKMLIVGGGPAIDELKKLAEEEGIADKTIFTGPVNPDNVCFYYALGDVFVSASTSETQGLTFMEAMASDNILLARYDDALSDLIVPKENGFFFFDEEDMAKKLEESLSLSKEEKETLFVNAHKSIEPYSLERFYQSVYEVYERARKKNY